MKLLLTLSYLGTAFHGYQVQPGARTVQGELNKAARALFGVDCDITGCSRTDTGVHANMFCVTVAEKGKNALETSLESSRIPLAMNAHLPADIAICSAEWVDGTFHPRYDVAYKEYVYRIYMGRNRSPFWEGRAWHIPQNVFTEETIEKMNLAAAAFVGEHDFSAFMASGSTVESTVRTVRYAEVTAKDDMLTFRVAADGFLYNMVRIMTGTLVAVAKGRLAADSIPAILASHDRKNAGMTAPAEGLYLNRVVY